MQAKANCVPSRLCVKPLKNDKEALMACGKPREGVRISAREISVLRTHLRPLSKPTILSLISTSNSRQSPRWTSASA